MRQGGIASRSRARSRLESARVLSGKRLRIQADEAGVSSDLLFRIIDDYLEDVAVNRVRRIAKALGTDEELVRSAIGTLKTLNPRPAGAFSPGIAPAYVTPDVAVRRFDGEWLIIPNNEVLPILRVSPQYRSMLREQSGIDEDTRRYLKDKVRSAEAFMRNIDRRRDTVSRIAQVIIEVQCDFFEDGKGDLRPLKLEDVAAEIGVHLSTVSRGVTGKYMATPYGLLTATLFLGRLPDGHWDGRGRYDCEAATPEDHQIRRCQTAAF